MNGNSYAEFLSGKSVTAPDAGFGVSRDSLHPEMFDFQKDVTAWALRKGRAALFLDTGMGKTLCQMDWTQKAAAETNGRGLIVAPLAVAYQTVEQGKRFGIPVTYARNQTEAVRDGITITNYERLEAFNPTAFGAVTCDESSILKSFDGVTRKKLIDFARTIPYRLCCTATPAPNDLTELANHAEHLGVSTRGRMLSSFFINGQVDDGGKAGWRLKGHARRAFFRWLASWGMSLRKPSDLGYSDEGFNLPPLTIEPVVVTTDHSPADRLFFAGLKGIQDRTSVRRNTLCDRVDMAADLIAAEPDEQWLIWCGLDDEAAAIRAELTARNVPATEVKGSDAPEYKADTLMAFARGDVRRLVTKPKIASQGMNFQSCARMVFVGIGDSYEQYYQALRRCWRFGQTREVRAYIVYTDIEEDIYANVLRKERESETMAQELIAEIQEFEREELGRASVVIDSFAPRERVKLPAWIR